MCQAYLEMISPKCYWCQGGYVAGLGNWIPHSEDCPAITGDEAKKTEILNRRKLAEQERQMID